MQLNPKKNMNRQDAKVAKGMGFQTLQRRIGTRARGEFGVSVLIPKWAVLALAFRGPAGGGCPWQLVFWDQGAVPSRGRNWKLDHRADYTGMLPIGILSAEYKLM